jgi:hypothetical protein
MGHAYNNGLHTTSKGVTYDVVRFTGLTAAGPTVIAEDCKSGLVSSITRSGAGVFVVQFSVPYPAKIVICHPQHAPALANSAYRNCRYQQGSYSNTTGQLTLFISDATPAAADFAGAADEMHVLFGFNRYTR